jgi:hypothetical protein
MTRWRDGMGRVTVKADTGPAARHTLLRVGGHVGVVRAPGWLIVHGPATVAVEGRPTRDQDRADLADVARARRARTRRTSSPVNSR